MVTIKCQVMLNSNLLQNSLEPMPHLQSLTFRSKEKVNAYIWRRQAYSWLRDAIEYYTFILGSHFTSCKYNCVQQVFIMMWYILLMNPVKEFVLIDDFLFCMVTNVGSNKKSVWAWMKINLVMHIIQAI